MVTYLQQRMVDILHNDVIKIATMDMLDTLASMAADLTVALSAGDRYQRLLGALNRIIPYDAAALLRLEGEVLTPLAAHGLSPNAMGRRYARSDHPRLDAICKSGEPVRFAATADCPTLLTAYWLKMPMTCTTYTHVWGVLCTYVKSLSAL